MPCRHQSYSIVTCNLLLTLQQRLVVCWLADASAHPQCPCAQPALLRISDCLAAQLPGFPALPAAARLPGDALWPGLSAAGAQLLLAGGVSLLAVLLPANNKDMQLQVLAAVHIFNMKVWQAHRKMGPSIGRSHNAGPCQCFELPVFASGMMNKSERMSHGQNRSNACTVLSASATSMQWNPACLQILSL